MVPQRCIFALLSVSSHIQSVLLGIEYRNYRQTLNVYLPYARFFYPIFILAAAYIADNLCTKNGNSSIFKLKIRGL